jgi:aspartate/methionine/tyrosine aminotransferase
MRISPFRLERYFAQYEFNTPYLLCSSDCESLSVGELMAMSPQVREEFQGLWLGYTESQGNPVLRHEIAALYTGLEPRNILVHSGAQEAIFLFLNATLQPGDHVIVHWPCYQSLYEVAKSIGCEITPWVGISEDGWRLDPSFVARNVRSNTKAVLVNCPHNPTGYVMAREDWTELNRLSEQYGFIVFSDEVYQNLEYDPADRLPAFCEINERAVTLNVLSKSYGLAGLRIGWVATRNQEVYQQMAGLKDYTTICNSAPSEFLGIQALRNRQVVVGRNLEIIRRNLNLLDAFFARNGETFKWVRPKAGPIAFPALVSGEDAESFCHAVVEQAGVLLLPGAIYDPAYSKHFRLGYGRDNMPQAVERLEEFLIERKKK